MILIKKWYVLQTTNPNPTSNFHAGHPPELIKRIINNSRFTRVMNVAVGVQLRTLPLLNRAVIRAESTDLGFYVKLHTSHLGPLQIAMFSTAIHFKTTIAFLPPIGNLCETSSPCDTCLRKRHTQACVKSSPLGRSVFCFSFTSEMTKPFTSTTVSCYYWSCHLVSYRLHLVLQLKEL